ncbi:facilitated trehalose transporter Tret1-like isoform X2 [Chrysoperla carnea]|uniref:facilitated trehalose transporter Tret1-like isoform X2 n=1 Tax=Chrysoperla carnea TaxID=189513 RepID=UPI001D07499A|nr:facilitated trehalose transporter Tret1-like isoform X2 [Chrysoperla carnea]
MRVRVLLRSDTFVSYDVTKVDEDDFKIPKYQVLAALSVSIGSLTVGFVSAYTSTALTSIREDETAPFTVNEEQESWIGSLMPLSALVGGIVGGPLIEYIGRKRTILMSAIPFIISWLMIAFAVNVEMIYAARILSGFNVGIASLAFPVYLGETLQPEVRGMLGLLPTALGNIGILLCFVAGSLLKWSHLALFASFLPVPFLILMCVIPETPRWYFTKGRKDEAETALTWLRGKNVDVSEELAEIEKSQIEAEKNQTSNGISELFQHQYLKPLMISLGLMFFQQMSGINAVIFYTVQIFEDAGSTIDSNLCTIIVGLVNFGSVFVATMLIDRLGRKILLYISSISMCITLVTLCIFFYLKEIKYDLTAYGWIPLASFVVYIIAFSLGFGPIPWLMLGEILPANVRGPAASIATAFNWSCAFIVTKAFKDLTALIGIYSTFAIFAKVCFIAFFFTLFCVPETQGRTLEDIEKALTGHKVRRMSSVINIKPMPTAC